MGQNKYVTRAIVKVKDVGKDTLIWEFKKKIKKLRNEYVAEGHNDSLEKMQADTIIGLAREWESHIYRKVYSGAGISFEDLTTAAKEALADETELPPEPKALAFIRRQVEKIGRNQQCPCGSGKKYKKCCG